MKNIFSFPTDVIDFGKHKGKQVQEIIKLDKSYFAWMQKEGFYIDPILIDLSNNIDIVKSEIKHNFDFENWTLNLFLVTFWKSKGIKNVRKSKRRDIKKENIASYLCDIPFKTEMKEWIEHIDCTKFHNDSIEVNKRKKIYHYNHSDLETFINNKLKIHGLI